MALLAGIHDREGRHIVPPGGWCLDTIALSENPPYTDYAHLMPGINWIVRLNWGYGSTGTLPVSERYADFADRVVAYVAHSPGCSRWIVGNEPNLSREWPNGKPILPWDYAECYLRCRAAIHALPGHERDEVLIAAPGPWNAELRYTGNPNGDWIQYFVDVFEAVGSNCDGFSLHAYTHGYDPALVASEKRMDAPFENRHYEFRTYKDFLAVVPFQLRELPVYITEANGNGPWEARGLMPTMLREISEHNESGGQPISCVIFYRYPRYDEFHMEGKADVLAEFQQAAQRQWAVPVPFVPDSTQEQNYMPLVSTGPNVPTATPQLPERQISEDFKRRVPQFTPHAEMPGRKAYRLVKAEYVPDGAQRFGPDHHILVNVLDANGNRAFGVPVNFYWADGETLVPVNKTHGPYGADYGMTNAGHSFGVWVGDSHEASDNVFGMGLGKIGSEHMGEHVSYYLVFQEVEVPSAQQAQPAQPSTMPPLVHPVTDARYRTITQVFGVNGEYYSRFSVDGVPLKGHNGIDYGTPIGTVIAAVDTGKVVEVAYDESGYGRYVKLVHSWGESLYAHLDEQYVSVGETVGKGEYIGTSGNTGNSTGPHLHFGLRVSPFNRRDGWGGFTDPLPYLSSTAQPVTPRLPADKKEMVKALALAALEFGVDSDLILSQAWAESSYNPRAVSSAGAKGLMQVTDETWVEWSARIGAGDDPFNAQQNARVGAAYMQWLLKQTRGSEFDALVAYGWGIGNWLHHPGGTADAPEIWLDYAAKVIHGRDLLKAVGA